MNQPRKQPRLTMAEQIEIDLRNRVCIAEETLKRTREQRNRYYDERNEIHDRLRDSLAMIKELRAKFGSGEMGETARELDAIIQKLDPRS